MTNKIQEANLAMVVSKTFSGLNVNALRYLLPLWIAPLTGVTFRCVFAAVAIYGYLILVVASIVSFLVGQDRFSWEQLGAMLLICVGVYWVEIAENNGRERKRPHSPSIT